MHFKTIGGRMIRNHVMITLTPFERGEAALDHGSRFESDGGADYCSCQSVSARSKCFSPASTNGEALPEG